MKLGKHLSATRGSAGNDVYLIVGYYYLNIDHQMPDLTLPFVPMAPKY